ncbi:hypothetical protein ABB37_07932 [Leptomonas pyrrhocoris]|uniref:Uncharacterized protein n=1 Tax=Leptomonas pyrrhocoris TaxID=157538 RepID=A0A0N0DSN1_LEPPY|nr:hypothetical protein ABB37_07928 [Leptomonas pyrrhocoris]XP_015654609.1 hypothetical protein ABB37_07930 [Leptomonas pyrrhocoris]XP_015654611.1 hypothetical protein ABB37_07932 [Leptomonas pyrrhocoris]KPA76168.1 hypothetical protein ABB37_07928 [Leptomonas pyrrhocoris]KPA76170.1 hypothetical protein ABB37_07930 [Leptomonas pyrrhocoris]KPA76172.1 hypothetical protein ABB37_07932 [Leptomonas pyrrhocoris]|eukprot:XP_015654607.1 hypothetical protein ABB37_07928 [Leptomonas pyrrhocoris]
MLHAVWPMQDFTANTIVLALAAFCFVVSLCCCLVMGFSPIGAFSPRGVLQSLVSPLTAVVTAITTFVSFQVGIAAFVKLL